MGKGIIRCSCENNNFTAHCEYYLLNQFTLVLAFSYWRRVGGRFRKTRKRRQRWHLPVDSPSCENNFSALTPTGRFPKFRKRRRGSDSHWGMPRTAKTNTAFWPLQGVPQAAKTTAALWPLPGDFPSCGNEGGALTPTGGCPELQKQMQLSNPSGDSLRCENERSVLASTSSFGRWSCSSWCHSTLLLVLYLLTVQGFRGDCTDLLVFSGRHTSHVCCETRTGLKTVKHGAVSWRKMSSCMRGHTGWE
jgi:hypothetical protein